MSILVTNFKTYEQATGENALKLAMIHEKIALRTNVDIIVAVQAVDLYSIAKRVKIPVFCQHVDCVGPGKATGSIIANSVKQAGASGTILNHSEHKIDMETLGKTIKICNQTGLKVIACVHDLNEVEAIAKLGPDYIAFEDPQLIGTMHSISRTKPESVRRFVNIMKRANPGIIPLCGAGIANSDDIRAAIQLGVNGVLLASAVVKADDPENALKNLSKGFE